MYNRESPKTVHKVMEALYNYGSIVWMYRYNQYPQPATQSKFLTFRRFSGPATT